jgi:hypothetical protein
VKTALPFADHISGASFRDPAGYVYRDNGMWKRVVTDAGAADYQQLMSSGLYQGLADESLLISHQEEAVPDGLRAFTVLVPEQLRYISYPYEWSFGQLRDAALLTLRIQELALQFGMSLKDASAFNVQFRGSQPIFIDTLSFEPNTSGPWVAYNQFCRHFLGPLLLMSEVSPNFNQFWKASLDGFPLDLVSSLLPKRTFARLGVLLHIHLHARMIKRYEGRTSKSSEKRPPGKMTPDRKAALAGSLRDMIASLKPGRFETEWRHYYGKKAGHYSSRAEESKKTAVGEALERVKPLLVYDLGGNVGEYSRIATERGIYSVCFDIDPLCVHDNYERAHKESNSRMLPLLLDLTNPTPALGFGLQERGSFVQRGQADMVLALALIHHLRITGNTPFRNIARFLSEITEFLLIEYVPKTDVMVQTLLGSRKDTFFDYDERGFHEAFDVFFETERSFPVADTDRTLHLLKRRRRGSTL